MIRIIGRPEFQVPMTLDQVNVLIALSVNHYDVICKAASGSHGFLRLAATQLKFAVDMDMEETMTLSYIQLDSCIRILEWTSGLAMPQKRIADELFKLFVGARDAADEVSRAWVAKY